MVAVGTVVFIFAGASPGLKRSRPKGFRVMWGIYFPFPCFGVVSQLDVLRRNTCSMDSFLANLSASTTKVVRGSVGILCTVPHSFVLSMGSEHIFP